MSDCSKFSIVGVGLLVEEAYQELGASRIQDGCHVAPFWKHK
jgi:hypothetical protein